MSVPSGHSEGPLDTPEHGSRVVRFLARASFVAGAAGLLATMALEAVAVLGRHVGLPVLGSIELVQAAVVLMGSSALVGTTLNDRHASVHLFTERLAPRPRGVLRQVACVASALFFAFLMVGSLILVHDLWDGDERSELLGLPYAPLRLLFVASVALIVILCLGSALARRSQRGNHVG